MRTEARVAYDDTAVYVAVRAWDADAAKIVGILTRRDQRSPSDWIRIVLDSYFDKRSAYEFGVNPVGVKTDRYYFNDGQSDDGWDAVWDVQVEKDAEGWRAEFAPFRSCVQTRSPAARRLRVIGSRPSRGNPRGRCCRASQGFVSHSRAARLTMRARRRILVVPYSAGQDRHLRSRRAYPLTDRRIRGSSGST